MIIFRIETKEAFQVKTYQGKRRKIIIITSLLLTIVLFFTIINVIPPSKVIETNPFISTKGLPMACVHRGGGVTAPENTLKAYKTSLSLYDAEIFETDLWLTKDGKIVLNHDETLNRTSDCLELGYTGEVKISDLTLEELQNFNFGYNFQDDEGNYPYRNLVDKDTSNRKEIIRENDLAIVEINDFFKTFYDENPNLLFIVEIKNSGDAGYKVADMLDELLTNKYPLYKNRIVIGTFHNEIEKYLRISHPSLLRGASTNVATKFILTQMFKVNLFDNDKFACLQIPPKLKGIDLTWNTYISRAHKRNIAVQYWTINDEAEMKKLISKNVDAIMTDNPILLKQVLDEYRNK